MVDCPDYKDYQLVELYQALNSIAAEKYPENFAALEREIIERDPTSKAELERCYFTIDKDKWPNSAKRLSEQIEALKQASSINEQYGNADPGSENPIYSSRVSKPRCCPNCNARFVPWQVWRITRWSSITCPSCGVALNRRLDAQDFLHVAVSLAVFITLRQTPGLSTWASFAIMVTLIYALDVSTVRLVVKQVNTNRAAGES